MTRTISIVLADDHKMVREGLKTIIEKQPDMKIVAEADNGDSVVEQAKKHHSSLLIVDVSMPGMNGIEATKKIIKESPHAKVLMLSMHADKRFVTEALNAGASGYVLKDSAADELIFAIRKIYDGEIFLSSKISEVVVKDNAVIRAFLSLREKEVLRHLADGMTTKEIASRLGISAKTVEAHRHQIMEKLQLHSIAELTKYAIREGITRA